MTAHAAKGQTLDAGAVVGMKIGGSTSAMFSCVALTRETPRGLAEFPSDPTRALLLRTEAGLGIVA